MTNGWWGGVPQGLGIKAHKHIMYYISISHYNYVKCWTPIWLNINGRHVSVFFLWHFVTHLNGQVGWVSLHLLSLLIPLLLSCWWPLTFWAWVDIIPSLYMEGGSSPASKKGLASPTLMIKMATDPVTTPPAMAAPEMALLPSPPSPAACGNGVCL